MVGRECASHPGAAAAYYCDKYDRYLCENCIVCQDPDLYCKSRTMCVIWEVSRHEEGDTGEESGGAESR